MWGRHLSHTHGAKLSHSGIGREHIHRRNFDAHGQVPECTDEVLIRLDAIM